MKNQSSHMLRTEYQRYVDTKIRIMGLKNNSLHMENNVFTYSFISTLNYHYYNELYSDTHQTLNKIHITSENHEIYLNNLNSVNTDNINNEKDANPILNKSKTENIKEKNFNYFQIKSLCKSSVKSENKSNEKQNDTEPKKLNKSDETSGSFQDISSNKKITRLSSSSGKVKLFSPTVLQILGVWLGNHGSEPYANPMEVAQLSIVTGLSKKQIRKWLANKRSRNRKMINVIE
ncbi:hypothetical protein A3Q56_06993 [Intoshia linei]|uniref:Homeobox domain-containing protein n=1 Tax=Intoshia linei TaxID=1819745 RepID=A0A177ATZ1_9BILA|nr:hypothetical protein A3Q56_06993 [Intoshia linei]